MSADQGVLGRYATVLDAVAASPNGLILRRSCGRRSFRGERRIA
jgi:hypothetical protein